MFKSLRTIRFRNLADAETDIFAKNVFLTGKNGQGKTNFLEALYFCSYASSFRGASDGELAWYGSLEKDFAVAGSLDSGAISIKVEKGRKTVVIDGKRIEDRKELLETIPCVAFCHEDMDFVSGSQEHRRWFFDQTQSLYDPVYLDDLRKYKRVLKNRNAVLRNCKFGLTGRDETSNLLYVLDSQLAEYGTRLMEKRRTSAEKFSAVFSSLYGEVSGIDGVGVIYVPSWRTTAGTEAEPSVILGRLEERREADLVQGITVTGPHRDRYVFTRRPGGKSGKDSKSGEFSGTASTGQRRLLALLLRVAQARCFSGATGRMPVLLLDDVLLELDGEKRQRFLSVLPDCEQAFFTFLPEEPYENYRDSGTMTYIVNGGVITPDETNRGHSRRVF